MFVTQELKEKVRFYLRGLSNRAEWLAEMSTINDEEWTFTYQLAAERALFTVVEFMTDIASDVIDALVMRDAGGYADLLKVLVEEGVLSPSWFDAALPLVDFRTHLLREHAQVALPNTVKMVRTASPILEGYTEAIRRFLSLGGDEA